MPLDKAAIQKEVNAVLPPPQLARIKALKITDKKALVLADNYLSKIIEARKTITAKFENILAPLNAALNETRKLRREIDAPYGELEDAVRAEMAEYRAEERRLLMQAEQERIAAETKARLEAEAKRLAAERAKTPKLRERLQAMADDAEAKADTVASTPVAEAVQLAGSTTRTVQRVRVTDLKAMLQGIINGDIPEDVIITQENVMERYHRMNDNLLKTWPGVEVYEEIQVMRIGGRRA